MLRPRIRVVPLVAVSFISLVAPLLTACTGGAEQSIVSQFFNASRLRDNTSLGNIAMVSFDPRTQGTVTGFSIESVSTEQRKPLEIKSLAKAQDDAKAEDDAFSKKKDDFQTANMEAIRRVLKAQNEKGRISGSDAEVQATWSKFLEDGAVMSRKVADAKRKLRSESQIVDLSVNTGSTHVDIAKYEGELVSKDVTIAAPVKLPSGDTANKRLLMTLQRAMLKGDKEITGRWVITGLKDLSGAPSTPRS